MILKTQLIRLYYRHTNKPSQNPAKPNPDHTNTFPIDLVPNGFQFGAKPTKKA